MALITIVVFYLISISCSRAQESAPQIAPALYVFGDSTVDSANAYMGSPPPFGRTVAGFIASFLGLPQPASLISLTNEQKANTTTGINYGFAGAGVLPETGDSFLNNTKYWDFSKQLLYFNETVQQYLSKIFNPQDLSSYLSKSVFLISFGMDDYIFNILPPANKSLSRLSPTVFSEILTQALATHLRALYALGARKMIVKNLWPLGCSPAFTNGSSCCDQFIDDILLPFTKDLPTALNQLKSELSGSLFTTSNDFQFVRDLTQNPGKYGIINTMGKCIGNTGANCDEYLYFDGIHTTQAASRLIALNCFNYTLCSPLNIVGLVGTNPSV